jgi:hypothetical protein
VASPDTEHLRVDPSADRRDRSQAGIVHKVAYHDRHVQCCGITAAEQVDVLHADHLASPTDPGDRIPGKDHHHRGRRWH